MIHPTHEQGEFLFAVVRDVQRNGSHRAARCLSPPKVSIRCRARRTAEPVPAPAAKEPSLVSIRCRARRTAEPPVRRVASPARHCFYSLSCETYSGTCAARAVVSLARVSIRCRARRTAEQPDPSVGVTTLCFYSLSCETYSGTLPPPTPPLTCGNDVRLHTRPPEPSVALSSTHQ